MPHIPAPLEEWQQPGKKSCVDCAYACFVGEDKGHQKVPPAFHYWCTHPDDVFRSVMNRQDIFGTLFPCGKWEPRDAPADEQE